MRQKIMVVGILGAIALMLILQKDLLVKPISQPSGTHPTSTASQNPTQLNESPKIVSTKPDPLEEAIISASEVIEITFNRPLENSGEFKVRIDPKIDYKIELSQDRKTAKIMPTKTYEMGTTYTLFIGTDTKFEGVGEWKQEKIFHFKTIRYRGV